MSHDGLVDRARRLVARTAPLPEHLAGVDLMAVGGTPSALLWQREGLGLAGRGRALRIPLAKGLGGPGAADQALEVLRAIKVEDDLGVTGCGPLALGALPFDRDQAAEVVVPSVVIGADGDGNRWLTTIASLGEAPTVRLGTIARLPATKPPDRFSLVSVRPHADWCDEVARAVSAIHDGDLDKVVLAREVLVQANRPFVPADILRRLYSLYPSCMVFAVRGFVGASPELLVSRLGRRVTSHPLAGTVARSGEADADNRLIAAMLSSDKERHEHRLVVDAVAAALAPVCARLEVPEVPSIVSLRNVSHLGTRLRGDLAGREPATALELVARLHPTPAVAGTPTDEAVAYLQRAEGFERDTYAGAVGWVDASGDGEWAVGIRSAQLQGNEARLVAGVGVVADSDPTSELAETQLKLQALLAAVVRP
jgi:menaquinone-specific isochorismate synthase